MALGLFFSRTGVLGSAVAMETPGQPPSLSRVSAALLLLPTLTVPASRPELGVRFFAAPARVLNANHRLLTKGPHIGVAGL